MRKGKILSVALAVGLLLSSCGGNGGTTQGGDGGNNGTTVASQNESPGTSDVKLSVSIWDENQRAGIQSIIDDFVAETGIQAEIQVINWENYWTQLSAGASGGQLPDVFWMHSNEAQRYMENNLLLDLDSYVEGSDLIDLGNYPSDITTLYQSNGKQYAIPKDIDTIALWYNKKLFDEAKLSYPDDTWTWDTLYENAVKLTDKDAGIYGIAIMPDNNQAGYYNVIYDYGGYIINDDKTKSGYDDPKTVEAMKFVAKLVEDCNPPMNILTENKEDGLFTSGKAAMILQGSWMLPVYKDNEYTKENADIAVLPKYGDKRVSIYNGLGWAAAANTEHPEEAWKLIEYFGSEKAQKKQAELGVTMSAYKGTSDAWTKSTDLFNLQAYLDMMDDMVIRPYSRNTVVWENKANDTFKEVWSGTLGIEEALQRLAGEMNSALASE